MKFSKFMHCGLLGNLPMLPISLLHSIVNHLFLAVLKDWRWNLFITLKQIRTFSFDTKLCPGCQCNISKENADLGPCTLSVYTFTLAVYSYIYTYTYIYIVYSAVKSCEPKMTATSRESTLSDIYYKVRSHYLSQGLHVAKNELNSRNVIFLGKHISLSWKDFCFWNIVEYFI